VVKMATVTARVDENVKKEAETLFKKMGLNMSTAMNLQETDDILSGKIEKKGYNSAEELFEDLGVKK